MRMKFARLLGLVPFVLTASFTGTAFAQTTTTANQFDANRFQPAERGSDWFSMDSLDLRGSGRFGVGATLQYARKPLEAFDATGPQGALVGGTRSPVIGNALLLHPGFSINLIDRLRIGATIPIQLADGDDATVRNVLYAKPANTVSVGDIRVALDVRVFGQYGDRATGAIGLVGFLPTGDQSSYLSDGTFLRVGPRFQVAGQIGIFNYALRLGVMRRDQKQYADSIVGTELTYGASGGFSVLKRKLLIGPEIVGSSTLVERQIWRGRSTPTEMILGAHGLLGNLRVGGGVGVGLNSAYGNPDVRVLFGIEYFRDIPLDADNDGVIGSADACPDAAGVANDDATRNGCPDEPVAVAAKPADTDTDGIPDSEDACPKEAGVRSDDTKTNGCPKPKTPSDQDGDGVADKDDKCPEVVGNGPDGCPLDTDKDGIIDAEDACIDAAGIKNTDPKKNGCPLDPDLDKDGILNADDACPEAAGPKNDDKEKNGCPMAALQNGVIKIREQIKFKTGSAEIDPGKESQDVMQAVLKVLKEHAEVKHLRIEGHTDNKGDAKNNKKLSADRAASVLKWFTKNGIEASRLTSEGFGPDKPIAPNTTEDGRKHNRRVEFHVE
jgi:OmpA-OmpF porin, OOP family